jgi:hypothetical protein
MQPDRSNLVALCNFFKKNRVFPKTLTFGGKIALAGVVLSRKKP